MINSLQLTNLFDSLPIGVIVFNLDGIIIELNQNLSLVDGFELSSKEGLLNTSIYNIPIFASVGKRNVIEKILSGEMIEKVIQSKTDLKGDAIFIIMKGIPVIENDMIIGGALIFEDYKIVEKLKSESNFQNLFFETVEKVLNKPAVISDYSGKVLFINRTAEDLGLTKQNYLWEVIPYDGFNKENFERIKSYLHNENIYDEEFKVGDDNAYSYFKLSLFSVDTLKDNYIITTLDNITNKVEAESELRHSEERFRNIVTNAREFIFSLFKDGEINYVNPHFLKHLGYSEEEVIGANFKNFVDRSKFLYESLYDFFETTKSKPIEVVLKSKSGRRIYTLASSSNLLQSKRGEVLYNVVLTDITANKESERDLLLIKSVFEVSQDAIAVLDGDKVILTNKKFLQLFNIKNSSAAGLKILDLIDDSQNAVTDYFADSKNKFLSKTETKLIRKDSRNLDVEITISSYNVIDKTINVALISDITERKRYEAALKESEDRYRNITENIDEFIWTAEISNDKLVQSFYTQVVERITGYSSDEFLQNRKLWLRIIHPDDVKLVVKKLRQFYKDPARISEKFEYRIINRIGNIVWVKNKINLLRNEEGKILKIFGLVSDITTSKKADDDLNKYTENLKTLNETKDRFISIISHDLRTPFSSILGFTDILLSDRNLPESKQVEYISFIQESSQHMLSLVNSLLDWTRLQTGRVKFEPERMNARISVNKAIQVLAGTALRKNINVVSEIGNDVFVHADESLLFQVFNNLISNAIKFTKHGGKIQIFAEPQIYDKQYKFIVKDNGVGIRKEDQEKLFKIDSKYTTNGTAGEKGSGLGLSLVYDIITKHGGKIWVESELGNGTEFHFSIPIASTKILLVDDSKTDRLLYTKLIKSIIPNYSIIESENGLKAYEEIKRSYPALVISDHLMPTMSGYDLVKQINVSKLKLKPPVIILSSDLNDAIIEEYKELGVEYIFRKPVNLTAFKVAIDKSLKKAIFS